MTTVFSFGAVLDESLEGEAGIVLAAPLNLRPGRLRVKVCLDRDQADAQGGEVAVDVVVLGAGCVLAHAGVAHPVLTTFAAAPGAPGQICKEGGATSQWVWTFSNLDSRNSSGI